MSDAMRTDWLGAEFDGVKLRLWVDGALSQRIVAGSPEQVLQTMLADLPVTDRPLLRSGWPDAALTPVPSAVAVAADQGRMPGLSQAAPADLMRHQPGRIRGFLTTRPDFDGVLCLIGHSTVWAHLSAGEVVSFRSFISAELFSMIRSFDALPAPADPADDGFAQALNHAMSRPAGLAADLAGLRAQVTLGQSDKAQAASRLAGLLIGAELAAARPYWLGQEVVVIGDGQWDAHYLAALASQGLSAAQADGVEMARAGLQDLWQMMQAKG
ncbi:2-dehydro-3-deoxygalactonokinase [Paracoccus fistulariae]|nr:2-dehydro-3-deoxygalactonokinase [Paracoccus fistulariae]MDB6179916.1 2-dehydro-3-deoxygalactonokinase [Paracoccus fistulariae]